MAPIAQDGWTVTTCFPGDTHRLCQPLGPVGSARVPLPSHPSQHQGPGASPDTGEGEVTATVPRAGTPRPYGSCHSELLPNRPLRSPSLPGPRQPPASRSLWKQYAPPLCCGETGLPRSPRRLLGGLAGAGAHQLLPQVSRPCPAGPRGGGRGAGRGPRRCPQSRRFSLLLHRARLRAQDRPRGGARARARRGCPAGSGVARHGVLPVFQ